MDTAFVTTWMAPLPGRGKKGFELIVTLEKYWADQAAQGNCTVPDLFLLPNGPGAITVKGRRQVLEDLTTSQNLSELLAKGYLLFQDWHHRLVGAHRAVELAAQGDRKRRLIVIPHQQRRVAER